MVNLLHNAVAGLVEKTLNAYLALDPETPQLIQSLQGKTLKVEVVDLKISLFFAPNPQGFSLYLNSDNTAQAFLSGRLLDLLEFALSDHPQAIVSSGKVNQSGELYVLQAYQRFMQQSHVDWEGLLSRFIGEAAAFETFKVAKKAKSWQRGACDSSCKDLTEYLQEEKRLVPPREEVEDFFEDIAKLREDVERLEARFSHLTSQTLAK